ncbi:cytochrome c oxidase assembly protein [Alphaproteobacteria bacterium]|nr:cytochrome c oxidase assembly protein [Alphaproteobacteria bacterium]
MKQDTANRDLKNKRTALYAASLAIFMTGMAFASVPLYDLFCRVTGFGGTTQRADAAPVGQDLSNAAEMTVRFDASVNRDLPWKFSTPTKPVKLRVGESALAFYAVENLSDEPIVGTATFNVSPPAAGYYFSKIECFCFTKQVLQPGEKAELPVTFFIDPEITEDSEMRGVTTITLSYTFFRSKESAGAETEKRELKNATLVATNPRG